MRHDISTSAARTGNGVFAGNNARATRACYAYAAKAELIFTSFQSICQAASGAFRSYCGNINYSDGGLRLTPGLAAIRREYNDNTYVNRCAPPGRNPGRSRHREQN